MTVDTTPPQIPSLLTTPTGYTTAANLNFQWQATDQESGIATVWAALGSDYYQTDITGGWVEVHGNASYLTRDAKGNPLHLANGTYYLTLRVSNGAGLETELAAPSLIVDNTPPPTPVVIGQGAYLNPALQPLKANWIWTLVDTAGGPVSYQWALVQQSDDLTKVNWNAVGQSTNAILDIRNTPGSLNDNATYYFVVKATNQAGLTSTGYSSGITIDTTAPLIPDVTLLQARIVGGVDQSTEVAYVTNTNNLELSIDSYDLNGVTSYNYTYGNQSTVAQNDQYIGSSTDPTFVISPPALDGVTVFKGICLDQATNISQPGYSLGVVLDTGLPAINDIHCSVSGHQLMFNWEATASVSPITYYEYVLVPTAQVGNTPPESSWTQVGLNRSLTVDLDQDNLADGKYSLLVRASNAAGTYSDIKMSPTVILDRQPPVLDATRFNYPKFADSQMAVTVATQTNLSGIGGYQYALGTQANPWQYSNGWLDMAPVNGGFNVSPDILAPIPTGTKVYLMVRARSNAGLWSEALVSQIIIIDHTPPTTPVVTYGAYSTSLTQITGVSCISNDPESGVTEYKLGIVTGPGQDWLTMKDSTITASTPFDGILTNLDLAEGQVFYIGIQTCNGAGTWSQVGYSQAVTVDTIPPSLSFTQGDRTIVLNAPPVEIQYTLSEPANLQFTLTAADGSSKTYTVTGQAGTNSFTFHESTPQIYQLSVQPVDLAGNIGATATQLIRANAPPQISLPVQFNITPGASLQLTATVVDPDGNPVTYCWDPGDGGMPFYGATPVYQYTKIGSYTLTLTVTDNDGGVTIATTTVNVGNTTQGKLYADETWSGIQHLYGNVTVPAGITLTILSGTQIIVDSDPVTGNTFTLDIQGNLKIDGAGQAVTFSSTTGQVNGWKGIYVEGTASLNQVIIQDAERGLAVVNGATATITNCTFQNNQVGLHVYGTQPMVSNTSFMNNTLYGIKEDDGGRPVVINCQFSGNGMDYYSELATEINIDQLNQIVGNSGNH